MLTSAAVEAAFLTNEPKYKCNEDECEIDFIVMQLSTGDRTLDLKRRPQALPTTSHRTKSRSRTKSATRRKSRTRQNSAKGRSSDFTYTGETTTKTYYTSAYKRVS